MNQEKWEAEFSGWKMTGGLGEFTAPGPFKIRIIRDGGSQKKGNANLITAWVYMGGGEGNWKILDKNFKGITDFDFMAASVFNKFTKQETQWRKSQ